MLVFILEWGMNWIDCGGMRRFFFKYEGNAFVVCTLLKTYKLETLVL